MATKKLRSLKGRCVRITRLDQCGNVVEGLASSVVSQGFITATFSEEIEDGEEITQKNAWGEFCIDDTGDDIMKWVNLSIQFCEVDPDILDIIGGATPVVVGGDTIGWTRGPHAPVGAFAIEIWTKAGGQNACVGGTVQWGYFVAPFVKNGKIDGDLNIENAPLNLTLVGKGFGATTSWAKGPYGDNPFLATSGFPVGEMYGVITTTVQPPAPTTGVAPVFLRGNAAPGDVYLYEPTVTASDGTNAAKLTPLGYITDPAHTTAWLTGEFMTVNTFKFNWTGAAWAAGIHA